MHNIYVYLNIHDLNDSLITSQWLNDIKKEKHEERVELRLKLIYIDRNGHQWRKFHLTIKWRLKKYWKLKKIRDLEYF